MKFETMCLSSNCNIIKAITCDYKPCCIFSFYMFTECVDSEVEHCFFLFSNSMNTEKLVFFEICKWSEYFYTPRRWAEINILKRILVITINKTKLDTLCVNSCSSGSFATGSDCGSDAIGLSPYVDQKLSLSRKPPEWGQQLKERQAEVD